MEKSFTTEYFSSILITLWEVHISDFSLMPKFLLPLKVFLLIIINLEEQKSYLYLMHFKGNGDSAIVQASLIWTMPTNIFKGGFTTPFLTG